MLLALLNTLFTIHSKLPALRFNGDPILTTSTLTHIFSDALCISDCLSIAKCSLGTNFY